MRRIRIALAVAAASTLAPAQAKAEHRSGPQFVSVPAPGPVVHTDRHRGRRGTTVILAAPAWPSEGWALYNNRSWEPDSYNDWWHDRPERAYPRWVQDSRDAVVCPEERMWWSGAGWRC